MTQPDLTSYRAKVIFALSGAITAVSTDARAGTVTYHRSEAAQACLLMAAVMLSGKAEDSAQPTAADLEVLATGAFKDVFAHLAKSLPGHVLDAELPGFTTHTLA